MLTLGWSSSTPSGQKIPFAHTFSSRGGSFPFAEPKDPSPCANGTAHTSPTRSPKDDSLGFSDTANTPVLKAQPIERRYLAASIGCAFSTRHTKTSHNPRGECCVLARGYYRLCLQHKSWDGGCHYSWALLLGVGNLILGWILAISCQKCLSSGEPLKVIFLSLVTMTMVGRSVMRSRRASEFFLLSMSQ